LINGNDDGDDAKRLCFVRENLEAMGTMGIIFQT